MPLSLSCFMPLCSYNYIHSHIQYCVLLTNWKIKLPALSPNYFSEGSLWPPGFFVLPLLSCQVGPTSCSSSWLLTDDSPTWCTGWHMKKPGKHGPSAMRWRDTRIRQLTLVHSRGLLIGCCSLPVAFWSALCVRRMSESSAKKRMREDG